MQLLWFSPQNAKLTDWARRSRLKQNLAIVLLVLSLLVQVGAVVTFLSLDQVLPTPHTSAVSMSDRIEHLKHKWWVLPVVVLFVTVGWWENFAYGKIKIGRRHIKLNTWRKSIMRVREASFVYSGFIQLLVCVGMAHVLVDKLQIGDGITSYVSSIAAIFESRSLNQHLKTYGLMYIQIISTFMCVFWSGLACRLYMQRLAFALPIILVPVVSGTLVTLCYPSDFLHYVDIPNICVTQFSVQDTYMWLTAGAGFMLWISYIIISKHIWYPQCERMAKMSRYDS